MAIEAPVLVTLVERDAGLAAEQDGQMRRRTGIKSQGCFCSHSRKAGGEEGLKKQ